MYNRLQCGKHYPQIVDVADDTKAKQATLVSNYVVQLEPKWSAGVGRLNCPKLKYTMELKPLWIRIYICTSNGFLDISQIIVFKTKVWVCFDFEKDPM